MNRLLRNIFFALALLLVFYAVLLANYLHATGQTVLRSKMVLGAALLAVFLAFVARRFSLKNKFKIFALLFGVLLVEIFLQAAAWLGVLPGVETKIKAPFARVYWTQEGRGNGIRNRDGWYAQAFDLKATHKIAYVGDSQVEGEEVSRTQNQAADLQKLLKQKSPDWSVLGLGTRGTCPAYYIDVLEYAWRHFQPQEAIVAVSIGSDVAETVPAYVHHTPAQFIFYDLDSDGRLVLKAASGEIRKRFDQSLEISHCSLLFNLPAIVDSHCMILQLVDSLHDKIARRKIQAQFAARQDAQQNGFVPSPFAVNPPPEARHAMKILLAELQQCKNVCDSHGMKFQLVTIPSFPKAFYDSQRGRDWTMRIGNYDYFGPEREVTAWARTNAVPIVSIGEIIQQRKMDVEEIRSLYFSNGTGHLTEKGHEFCAQVICENFYQKNSP